MAMSYWCSQVVFTPHTLLCRHRSRCLSPPSHTTSSSPTSPSPTPYLHKQSFQRVFLLHSCSKKSVRSSPDLSLDLLRWFWQISSYFFFHHWPPLNLTTCVTYSMQVNIWMIWIRVLNFVKIQKSDTLNEGLCKYQHSVGRILSRLKETASAIMSTLTTDPQADSVESTVCTS